MVNKHNVTFKENINTTLIIPLNSTDTQSITNDIIPQQNFTQIYEGRLSKISNFCYKERDFEELYGNKSKFGVVIYFSYLLVQGACDHIGMNELRHHLHLKQQPISSDEQIEERFEKNSNMSFDSETLKYFQEKIQDYREDLYLERMFWEEDLETAEKFLDRKLPEIRELYWLKYYELKLHQKPSSNRERIDEAVLEFEQIWLKIRKATEHSNKQSLNGLFPDKTSKCYNKKN